VVDEPVMAPAQQHQVRKRGVASMRPVHDVMGVTPALRSVTAGEATVAIPDHHGMADPRRDDRGSTTDVERLGCPPRDDPAHRGVAGKAPGGLRGDRTHILELGSRAGDREASLQGRKVHGDADVRALATHQGAIV
jgi:hypothetical protein